MGFSQGTCSDFEEANEVKVKAIFKKMVFLACFVPPRERRRNSSSLNNQADSEDDDNNNNNKNKNKNFEHNKAWLLAESGGCVGASSSSSSSSSAAAELSNVNGDPQSVHSSFRFSFCSQVELESMNMTSSTAATVLMVNLDNGHCESRAKELKWRRFQSLERSISPLAITLVRFSYGEIASATRNFSKGAFLGLFSFFSDQFVLFQKKLWIFCLIELRPFCLYNVQ